MSKFRCRICRRSSFVTEATLLDHMGEHSSRVLAEELLTALAFAAECQQRAESAERCGKRSYKSEETATRALLDTWAASSSDPRRRELRAYKCDRCPRWHLTSRPLRPVATAS